MSKVDQNCDPFTSFLGMLLRLNKAEARPNLAAPLPPARHEPQCRNCNDPGLDSKLAYSIEAIQARREKQIDPEKHTAVGRIPRRLAREMPLGSSDKHVSLTSVKVGHFGNVRKEALVAPVAKKG